MKKYSWILGGLLGLTMFLYICSPATLDVTDSSWMIAARQDTAHHNTMWFQYKNDKWRWPLTLFNTVTYPAFQSATYADIAPLYAVPCKLLRGILPDSFHYFGILTMLNFVLQGIFAVLLLQQVVKRGAIVAIGTIVMVTAPIMLYRVGFHIALGSHWVILMALWIYFYKKEMNLWLQWGLVTIALLIHPYLWIMCVAIVGVKTIKFMWQGLSESGRNFECKLSSLASSNAIAYGGYSFIVFMVYTLPSLYLIGFFSLKVADGVGWCTLNNSNLNTFINPSKFLHGNLVKPMPFYTEGQHEGMAYLGAGVLLLALLLSPFIIQRLHDRTWLKRHMFTLLMMVVFSLLAFGTVISWNDTFLFGVNLPAFLMDKYSIFRACGRFTWPVWYLIVVGLLCILDKVKYDAVVYVIVIGVAFVQLYDLGYAAGGIINIKWHEFRTFHAAKVYPDDLDKLDRLAQGKKCVYVCDSILMKDSVRTNAVLHYLALKKIAFLNTYWSARRSRDAAKDHVAIQKEIAKGIYRENYIYFLGKDQIRY